MESTVSDCHFNAEAQRGRDAEGQTPSAPPQLGDSAFKETEIGLVPEGWVVKPIKEVSEVVLGRTPSTKEKRYWEGGTILFITPGDLEMYGGVIRNTERKITEEGLEAARPLPIGAVVVSCIGNIGKVGVVDVPVATTNQQINAIVPGEEVDNWYMAYAMMHLTPILESRARMTTVPILNKTNFLEVPMPVPPLPEQRRIAEALRAIQEAIAAQEDVIAAARELKRSLMERLFTYGPGPEPAPTKETDFGSVPASWDIEVLDECAYIQTGAAKGRRLDEAETINVPYLRVANVQDGFLDLEEIKYIPIRKSERERYSLQPGDVVLTEGGDFDKLGRGFVWQNQIPDCIHQNHIFAVRVNQEVLSPEYLGYLVQSEYAKAYFLSVAHRTTNLACINKTKLGAFPVLIPSLEVQTDIAARLQTADAKIAAEEQRKAALESVFQSALEELMTGQIRVNAEPQRGRDAEEVA
jgi:type I restriction enzyme S subunit